MVFVFDDCELDLDKVQLLVHGEPCAVEPQVFDVLAFLVQHCDRMVAKEELLDAVWHHRFVTESALSSRIKSARRAIGDDGRAQRLIRTVHGRGYKFVGDVRAAGPGRELAQQSTPIPSPATPTIGRERDIAEVVGLLDRARLVTLLGPGGVGKTRLAVEVALRRRETIGLEGCFVDLTKVRDADLVPELIVRELGIRTVEESNARDQLAEAVRGRSLLVVLDNFEHVIDAAGIVADVVQWSPTALVLATSRARLRVAGEHVFDVAPLSVDPGESGESGQNGLASAVALFEQAATALDPSFRLEPNLADVVSICRTVDGLPLAIELAAGHIRTLPPALLRTRLGARLGSPAGAARDAPPRQQTIPATIDWSLQLLATPEQRLFARLGVFAGPVPLEAVEQVCADPDGDPGDPGDPGDVVEALGRLVDQSLVRRTAGHRGEARFGLLELLRERARDLLAADDEDVVGARHAAYVAAYVEEVEERRWIDAAGYWMELVTGHLGEIRAAHAWAVEHGEVELATRITASLGTYWHREGNHAEGRRWVTEALPHLDDLDARLGARLHLTAGFLDWAIQATGGRDHWEASAEAFRTLGHDRYLALSLDMLSTTYIGDQANYALALGLVDEAIALARRVGEGPLISGALIAKGELARVQGDDPLALAVYREAMELSTAAGDEVQVSMCLGNMSFLADHAGDHAGARRLCCEALRLCRRLGRRYTAAQAVSMLAGPELHLGRPEQGARLLGAAEEAFRVLGGTRHQGDRPENERVVAGLRRALGDDIFRDLYAQGARLSLDEAVEIALAEPGRVDETTTPAVTMPSRRSVDLPDLR